MNKSKFLTVLFFLLITHQGAALASTEATAAKKGKPSTNISFSGSSVDGQYHSAGQSVTEVDAEKKMNSLIGVRQNFHDQLMQSRKTLRDSQLAEAKSKGSGQ